MTGKKKEFAPAKKGRKPLTEGEQRLDPLTIVPHHTSLMP
jgi:hypothetical protein